MPIDATHGEPVALLAAELAGRCGACGAGVETTGVAVIPHDALSLRALEEIGELNVPLPACPDCGVATEPTGGEVLYLPDEVDLPALSCRTELAPGGPQSTWRLHHPDGRHEQVGVADEAELQRHWGRVLSVRERLRLLLAEADGQPGEGVSAPLGPSQVAYALRLVAAPTQGDDEAIGQALRRLIPSAEQIGVGPEPVVLMATGYNGVGDVADWAGPYLPQLLSGELMLLVALDQQAAAKALADCAARQGAEPAGFAVEELPEGLRPSHGALAGDRWFSAGGHRLHVPADEAIWFAAGRAVTLAEAAALSLDDKVPMAHRLGNLLEEVQASHPDEQVRAPVFETLMIGDEDAGTMVVVNLENAARRHDDDESVLADVATRVAQFRTRQRGCDCGGHWLAAQLRHPDDPRLVETTVNVIEEVTDGRGNRFALVATIECPHEISYPIGARLEAFLGGRDLAQAIEEGAEKARLVINARMARDAAGAPVGAVLRGDRIASVLANPRLRAALGGALVRGGLRLPLVADAPSTDVICVLRPDARAVSLVDGVLIEQRRIWDGLPGSPLGYGCVIENQEPPGRRIELRWPPGPSRADRRAARTRGRRLL